MQFKILRLDFNRIKFYYSFKWFVTLLLTVLHLRTRAQSALSPLLCEVHKVKKIWSYIIWHDICHTRCLWLILIFFWPLIKLVLNFGNKSIERLSPFTNHYHFLRLTPFSVSDYFLNIENENKYSCWRVLDFQSSVWCECGAKIMKASLFWQNRENVFQNIRSKLYFFLHIKK